MERTLIELQRVFGNFLAPVRNRDEERPGNLAVQAFA
jgi:hypothetical protein